MIFNQKPPTIIEFEKTTTKDLSSESISISIQDNDNDKCRSLFNHVIKELKL